MKKYYEWVRTVEAKKKLENKILDPDGLLTTCKGEVSGVYELVYVNGSTEISAYIGQAGFDATAPSYVAKNVKERIIQHFKRMLGNNLYYSYWTGLQEDDGYKIKVQLLCEENDHKARLRKESELISAKQPFLQQTQGKYQKYPRHGYYGNDIAIHPWVQRDSEGNVINPVGQRRLAFLDKVAEAKKEM